MDTAPGAESNGGQAERCFLCERQSANNVAALAECFRSPVATNGAVVVNGERREERERVLLKVFNIKVITRSGHLWKELDLRNFVCVI